MKLERQGVINECLARFLVSCLAGLAVAVADAKTVALWPIDWDYDNNEYDLRCATNPAYDLTPMKALSPAGGANTLAWNLPPNPDASEFLFTPTTFSSLMSTTGDGYLRGTLDVHMLAQHSPYTIEGWIKFTGSGSQTLGTGAAWIVMVDTGVSHLRMSTADGKFWLHVWAPNPTVGGSIDANFAGPGLTLAELRDGAWHHWALTHQPNDGNGKRIFEAFWDGSSVGTLEDGAVTGVYSTDGTFMLGTRGQYGNTVRGGMEYVRISDEVLAPSEFLCAGGGAGTAVGSVEKRTTGYWRLGRDAAGGVDGASALGGGPFTMSYRNTDLSTVSFTAHPDQAFDGQPPNPTVTLAGGNSGSISSGTGNGAWLICPGLGSSLVSSRDFTVETYFRPDSRDVTGTGSRALFGTMNNYNNDNGWSLQFVSNARFSGTSSGRRFRLQAKDETGTLYYYEFIGSAVDGWFGEWKHIAFVHHAPGGDHGFGYWEVYVDGSLQGALHDSRQLADSTLTNFFFGNVTSGTAAAGRFDCLRVCGAALSPSQFLCATNGTAATNVLAFFPFDKSAEGSAYSVFTDIVGSYSLGNASLPAASKTSAQTDEPTITNPDSTAGISSFGATNGSIGFGGYGGASGVLHAFDRAVQSMFNARSSYTIEAYVKHEGGTPSGDQQILLVSTCLQTSTWPSMDIRLAYGTNGFKVSDIRGKQGNNKFQDIDTGVTMTDNEWHHVALVADFDTAAGTGVWRLYVDGICQFTSSTYSLVSSNNMDGMEIGGRDWGSAMLFRGKIAHLRISRAALDPSEFLCASVPAAETAVTLSYWPLDFQNALLDLGDRVLPLFPFASAGATGNGDRAALKAVHPSVAAEQVANKGSVLLAGGSLVATNAAGKVGDLTRPFTVEGYVKWTNAAVQERETVCGTYRNEHGWKLVLDNTGATPTFRIYGCGRLPTSTFVDASFGNDASRFAGEWRHVALCYEPTGTGVWRLYVNGTLAGTVENDWNPSGVCIHQDMFMLGADASDPDASFVGGFDLWRISTGLRGTDDLLYPGVSVPGMTVIFR